MILRCKIQCLGDTSIKHWPTLRLDIQYAAEADPQCVSKGNCGTDGRTYPWGGQDPSTGDYMPSTVTSYTLPGADAVDAHPKGCSAYGACDMVGNVWQVSPPSSFRPNPRLIPNS